MRQPDVATLQVIVAALPDDRLRPLLLELLGAAAAPLSASADAHTPADAASTRPTPLAKNRGGRPKGSLNKTTAGATGHAQAARLRAQPGREQLIRDVVEGKLTRAAAAREFGTSPRTISAWVEKFRREQPKPAAPVASTDEQIAKPDRPRGPTGETPAQRTERLARHAAKQRERDAERRRLRDADRAAQAAQPSLPIGNGHDDAGRLTISAARPAAAKPNEADPAAEAALAARLWERATEISPTSPWRAVVQEFGINSALAVDHFRHRSLPHVAPAAVERWVEATTAS